MKRQIRKAAKSAKKAVEGRDLKRTRALSLKDNQFRELQAVCESQGVTVSEVIDELIGAYLDECK